LGKNFRQKNVASHFLDVFFKIQFFLKNGEMKNFAYGLNLLQKNFHIGYGFPELNTISGITSLKSL